MYSIILIVTLIIVSGIIAYIGDLTGFRIGKKKISIFGLRPHRTAVFITIITGIVISILTISILSILSNDVRTALFGLDELREKQYELSREVQSLNIQLTETQEALTSKTEDLEQLEEEYQQLNNQISIQTQQLESLIEIRENLTKERDSLQQEITELEETVQGLSSGIRWLRSGDIILDQGEEIAMAIIQGGQTEEEIEQEIVHLLAQATRTVLEAGAEQDEESGQVLIISRSEYEDIIQKIKESETSLVVRLLASMNVIRGEMVLADVSVLENRLIFEKDEVVLVEEVPALNDSAEVEDRLFAILRKVNLRAVQEGIIPESQTSLVGTISAVNLFETVRTIAQSDTGMLLKVIAIDDTWTTGPFKVRMEVEKILH
ncbi:MAG: DUF3084 domain-containing protein [Atribacterota bacterium]|jgi:uncharacterized protein (DUF3084 family)|nr:DUF3084 domain-containing protein [Atribacterota bacterium]